MVTVLFGRRAQSWLDQIDGLLSEVLTLAVQQIQDATTALATPQNKAEIESAMHQRQQEICSTIEAIRSRLVVHAAVRGAEAHLPLLLTLMSVTKDADAISHLANQIPLLSDLAGNLDHRARADIGSAGHEVTDIISGLPAVLTGRDTKAASKFLDHINERLTVERERTLAVKHAGGPESLLALGLFHSHVSTMLEYAANAVSSVTQPVHRLDHLPGVPR